MAVICIKNLKVPAIIGYNPEERLHRQDLVINLEIEVDIANAIEYDNEQLVYNYKTITKKVIDFVSGSSYNLLEKLTHEVLSLVMADERVNRVSIEIDKPGALRFSESVSVKMEAGR